MTDRPLRILVLADSRSFHTDRYVSQMRRFGCRVVLASLEQSGRYHFQLKRRGRIASLHYVLSATQLNRLIRRLQPDIINPHFVSGYGFVSALAGARRHAPIFTHLWGSDVLIVPGKSRLHRWKVNLGLSASDMVCADSQYVLDRAGSLTDITCPQFVIPWGIERGYLDFHRSDYSLVRPVKIIVPRPHEPVYRNLPILHALAPLINEDKIRMTFPDFGTDVGWFESAARKLVGDKLKLYSRLPRTDFMRLMSSHDIYLSNSSSDSSPATLIEAMGLGLIPIAATHPGLDEWLNPESGFQFDGNRTETASEIIEKLIRESNRCEEMRRRNLERVRQVAVFEDNINQIIGLMKELRERSAG